MAYKKVVSGVGVISVFTTDSRKFPSCTYCVVRYPEDTHTSWVWAVIAHHSCAHLGHVKADEVEISEEEYRAHIKFALRALESQSLGTPLPLIITTRPRLFDGLNYDQHAEQQAG
jgi:hypothetical protein